MHNGYRPATRLRPAALCAALIVALTLLAGTQGIGQAQGLGYVLGPDDVLEVSVWGYADLTRTVTVRPDGKVAVPLVGTVAATGVSVEQLTRTLTRAYAAYIVNPQVTVIVKEFRKIRVSVLGQVARPGTYTLSPGSRVLQAISAAGGIVNGALIKEVRLVVGAGQIRALQADALLQADPRHNPELKGGETIVVPEVNKLTVSIVGQVNRPGPYELLPGARLLDLVAAAGGVTDAAALKDSQLLRPGDAPVVVDLERVLAGDPQVNTPLRGGETLVVREDLVNMVSVLGQVARPGRFRLKGDLRVVDALLLAGGLTERASVTSARLVRGTESHPLALDNLLLRQDMSYNVPLRAGDSLFIPEEINNKIYVLGDVTKPGVFETRSAVTVLQAVAMAGGPVQRGAGTAKTAHILRRSGGGEPALIAGVGTRVEQLSNGALLATVDLQALVSTGDPTRDVAVRAGDIVVVPQTSLGGLQVVLNILSGILSIFR